MKDDVMNDRFVQAIFGGLLLASVFALGIVKMEDYDAWTHLALGRDIVQHRGFPATEQFNFPSLDLPYYNSEWLFGLLFYLVYLAAGIDGVIFLKASLATLAFFVLFRDSLIPADQPSHRPLGLCVVILVLFPILLLVRHRFVERPDIVLMVFLGFTIYALNAYVYEGKRYVYLLPVMQVIWVNMHPSIVVGTVPFIAYLVGGLLQRLLRERLRVEVPGTPSISQLRMIAAVFSAVLAASLLNPYGIDPFLAPFRLMGSQWLTQEILELQPPSLDFFYGAPYIIAALLGLVFLVSIRRLSLTSVLLVVPFVYLGLSAKRFIFLLAIVSAPVLARHLRSFAARLPVGWARGMALTGNFLVVLLVVGVTAICLARVAEPFADWRKNPGLGIAYEFTPEGALRYLDRVGISGRIFNPLYWGGYIVWRDYPHRLPIGDGRAHVPAGLLDEIKVATSSLVVLDELRAKFGFDVALVDYPVDTGIFKGVMPNRDLAMASPDWALVYWDHSSLVYLRRTEKFAEVIARDEYRQVKPANGVSDLKGKLRDKILLSPIETELRRNITETQSSMGYMLLGVLYNQIGDHKKAIESLKRVQHFPFNTNLLNGYLELALAYSRLGDLKQAAAYYKKALRHTDDAGVLYAAAMAFEGMGNYHEAIRYLERALSRDRRLPSIYPALIRAYQRVGRTDRLQALESAYREALAHGESEKHFRTGVKFYVDGKLQEAIVEFQQSLKANPANPAALTNLGFIYFDIGLLDRAFAEQRRALEFDPNHANAHYGLALIYRARGEHAKAKEHLKKYLRLQPRGYWSRKAQEMLHAMRGP